MPFQTLKLDNINYVCTLKNFIVVSLLFITSKIPVKKHGMQIHHSKSLELNSQVKKNLQEFFSKNCHIEDHIDLISTITLFWKKIATLCGKVNNTRKYDK